MQISADVFKDLIYIFKFWKITVWYLYGNGIQEFFEVILMQD